MLLLCNYCSDNYYNHTHVLLRQFHHHSNSVLSASSFTFSGGPTTLDSFGSSTSNPVSFGGGSGDSFGGSVAFGQTPTFGASFWNSNDGDDKKEDGNNTEDNKKDAGDAGDAGDAE